MKEGKSTDLLKIYIADWALREQLLWFFVLSNTEVLVSFVKLDHEDSKRNISERNRITKKRKEVNE